MATRIIRAPEVVTVLRNVSTTGALPFAKHKNCVYGIDYYLLREILEQYVELPLVGLDDAAVRATFYVEAYPMTITEPTWSINP